MRDKPLNELELVPLYDLPYYFTADPERLYQRKLTTRQMAWQHGWALKAVHNALVAGPA